MEMMSPTDAMFLVGESREHPMHVGGLQLFEPPAGRLEGVRAGTLRADGRPDRLLTHLP